MGIGDELLKYKELLDNGLISTEEFDILKKQLLSSLVTDEKKSFINESNINQKDSFLPCEYGTTPGSMLIINDFFVIDMDNEDNVFPPHLLDNDAALMIMVENTKARLPRNIRIGSSKAEVLYKYGDKDGPNDYLECLKKELNNDPAFKIEIFPKEYWPIVSSASSAIVYGNKRPLIGNINGEDVSFDNQVALWFYFDQDDKVILMAFCTCPRKKA